LVHWARVRAGLLETIGKFEPEHHAFRPFEGSYSVREIILHIAHEEEIEVLCGLAGARDAMPQAPSLPDEASEDAVLSVLGRVHGESERYVGALSEADLREEVALPWGARATRIDTIMHVVEHEIHHRGELSLILGLLGRRGLDA
jgi:uncharacterized damage-inducible protein DinB